MSNYIVCSYTSTQLPQELNHHNVHNRNLDGLFLAKKVYVEYWDLNTYLILITKTLCQRCIMYFGLLS